MTAVLKSFLFAAAVASCSSTPEGMAIRFEIAEKQFVSCAPQKELQWTRTIIAVNEGSLVMDACPDYAECGTASERTLELASESLPDLRTVVEPEQRLTLRMNGEGNGRCAWEVAVTSRETPPRLLFFAANGVTQARTAHVIIEPLEYGALRVRIDDKRELRIDAGKTAEAAEWRVHNVDGQAIWMTRK